MKLLYNFYPVIGDTTSATFTVSPDSVSSNFPVSNLFTLEPVRSFKTTSVSAMEVVMDMKSTVDVDFIFLNRINFSEYTVSLSTDNSTYTNVDTKELLATDEIADEKYMHAVTFLKTPVYARYVKITVPANKAVFEPTYYKIGNLFAGKCVDMMNPKNGFQVKYNPSMNITKFKSGYISREPTGRTNRTFDGNFDKLNVKELDKFRLTYKPFVIWLDYTGKNTSCYLVMNTTEMAQTYDYAKVKSMNFTFEEIV